MRCDLDPLGNLLKCQETSSIALLVWRLAAWASRQADGTPTCDIGHSAHRAPGGRGGFARRNNAIEILEVRWRLATRDRCASQWSREAPSDRACDNFIEDFNCNTY